MYDGYPVDAGTAAGWARAARRYGWPLIIAWVTGLVLLAVPLELLHGAWNTAYGIAWLVAFVASGRLLRRLRPSESLAQ